MVSFCKRGCPCRLGRRGSRKGKVLSNLTHGVCSCGMLGLATRLEMDGVDDEVERRLELAATIGLDARKLVPANSGKSRWSEFELDAYLHGSMAWPKPQR